jgi:streptogramin lyase
MALTKRIRTQRQIKRGRGWLAALLSVERLEDRCLLSVGINEFAGATPGGWQRDITAGPDGNIWFTEENANKIGRLSPLGDLTEFTIPTPNSGPLGITAGPDGNIWFTEHFADQIGRIGPNGGGLVEFAVPTPGAGPCGITAGPDGNIWFTEDAGNQIGQIALDGSTINEFSVPTASSVPSQIITGPDGNLWFTELSGNQIGRITPAGSAINEFPVPTANSMPDEITTGPDGNLWFTELNGNQIGQITPDGSIVNEFGLPTAGSMPTGIAAGPDGNLWFTEQGVNRVGQISTDGSTIAEFATPSNASQPWGMTLGPDNNLWFTESALGQIGQIVVNSTLHASSTTVHAAEASVFSGVVANFSDDLQAGVYNVVIHWGDGTESSGWAQGSGSTYQAFGAHRYAEEGAYTVNVLIRYADSSSPALVSSPATIADPAVQATGNFSFNALVGIMSASQTVATFTDPVGPEALGDYRAMINWGDNSTSSGTITFNAGTRVFTVQGAHLYNAAGNFPVTVTIYHDLATAATAQSTATVVGGGGAEVLTQHNDSGRDGANLVETTLTTSNVGPNTFGKLYTLPVDGSVYAQPLYMSGLTINGSPVNVVFVATMHNSVYAFNADSSSATPLWVDHIGSSIPLPDPNIGPPGYSDISGEVGILSTPVISQADNTMYVVAARKLSASDYRHTLYKLDVRTGAVLGQTDVSGSVPGTGAGSSGGLVAFQSHLQDQRSGLLLANGHVYFAFASYGDAGPYHGWVFGYNAATLNRDYIFNTTADGSEGGVWESGTGLTADASGNIYFMTGNGTADPNWPNDGNHRPELGECFVKLSPSLGVLDWFMVHNAGELNNGDEDLGASGPMLIPGTNELVSGGKEGRFYLLNKDNFGGHYNPLNDSEIVQNFLATGIPKDTGQVPPVNTHHIHGNPVYWNGPGGSLVYVWGESDWARAYHFNGSSFPVSPNLSLLDPKETLTEISSSGMALANANDTTLAVAWQGTNTVLNFESADDGLNFGSKVTFNETSNFRPSLAYGNGRYFLAWTGLDGRLNVMSSTDGITWGNKVTLSDTSDQGPALAFGNGRVFLAWKGQGNTALNVMSSTDGITWSSKVTLNHYSNVAPGLTYGNGTLYLVWAGLDTRLNIMESADGVSFSNQVSINQTSNFTPALTFFQGRYFLGWTGTDGRENVMTGASVNSLAGPQIFGDTSAAGPTLVAFKGQVEYGWSGTDNPDHLNVAMVLHPDPITGSILAFQGMPGGILSLSANGSQAGSGILWAYTPLDGDANENVVHGKLIAYNAATMQELWDTQMVAGDQIQNVPGETGGWYGKFAPPTVANGKVFVSTLARPGGPTYIVVYGLRTTGSDGSAGADEAGRPANVGTPIEVSSAGPTTAVGAISHSVTPAVAFPGIPDMDIKAAYQPVTTIVTLVDLAAERVLAGAVASERAVSSGPTTAPPGATQQGQPDSFQADFSAIDAAMSAMAADGNEPKALATTAAESPAPVWTHYGRESHDADFVPDDGNIPMG